MYNLFIWCVTVYGMYHACMYDNILYYIFIYDMNI